MNRIVRIEAIYTDLRPFKKNHSEVKIPGYDPVILTERFFYVLSLPVK